MKVTQQQLTQIIQESINEHLSEELDEATYPESFNLEEFNNIRSFAGRVRYCKERLQFLGQGSARIVFLIDENTVLKLAKNAKGIAQNEAEGQYDYYRKQIGLFAEVYEVDEHYQWIEMQRARKAKITDFKRITGYPFKMVQAWITNLRNRTDYNGFKFGTDYDKYFKSEEFTNLLYNDYTIFNQLEDYIGNYQLHSVGDLQRVSSWGVVTDSNNTEQLVLIDYGLNDDVYNQYYKR